MVEVVVLYKAEVEDDEDVVTEQSVVNAEGLNERAVLNQKTEEESARATIFMVIPTIFSMICCWNTSAEETRRAMMMMQPAGNLAKDLLF